MAAPQASYADERFYADDPILGWRLIPGLNLEFSNHADFRVRLRTDERGLRIGELPPTNPAILVVGDSFAFGWGVEADETFAAQAAASAGGAIWNAGVPLYDVCQAVDRATELLSVLRPRIVVVGVFQGNDEFDALTDRHGFEIEAGAIVPRSKLGAAERLRHSTWQLAVDHSHLLRLLRRSPPIDWVRTHVVGEISFSRWVARQRLAVYRVPASPEILEGSGRLMACVERLRDRSASEGAALVVVLLPDQLELEPERLAAIASWLEESGGAVDPAAPRGRLIPALAALEVPVVDPLGELLRAHDRVELYFRQDPHMTAAGHAIVARVLAPTLSGLLSVPGGPVGAARKADPT